MAYDAWMPRLGWSIDLRVPRVIGIVNCTPDSFSDGGELATVEAAVARAEEMIAAGAIGVDIGGESTRPGAQSVAEAEQIRRVVPVIAMLRAKRGALAGGGPLITVDTTRVAVAQAALEAGADGVNDVSGATDDAAMLDLCARAKCGIILMHRARPPAEDRYSTAYVGGAAGSAAAPAYGDVVHAVGHFLASRALAALQAGIALEAIMLDPGLGFGKSVADNLSLIARTGELTELGYPIMSGLSRKSFVGAHMNLPAGHQPSQRLAGTLDLSARHAAAGARLLRVHDVREHVEMISGLAGQSPV
ncbi:MAG: dihydropteroate synthase [Phycisphaerales bacterium]|nr:dihydropteroate synthase [Phycisphaerales bacterium]